VFIYPATRRALVSNIWVLTGTPGVGKSTIVSAVVLRLKSAGVIVGGCSTAERKAKGVRTGFDVLNLTDGTRGELASVSSSIGPRVGRYRVNLSDLSSVGASALAKAASVSEVIVIDEVGPMELVSPEFRKGVRACIDSGKPLLAVIHERLEDDLLAELRVSARESIAVTVDNRDEISGTLAATLLAAAGGPKTS